MNFSFHPLIFFHYFQIRHCAESLFPSFPSSSPHQFLEGFLCCDPFQKSLISKMYNKLLSCDCLPASKVKAAWESELRLTWSENSWDIALGRIHSGSACARLTLIQLKGLIFPRHICHKFSYRVSYNAGIVFSRVAIK